MAADNRYRKGVMFLVLLSLLKREDMYGYQLVQEIAASSGVVTIVHAVSSAHWCGNP